MTAKPVKLRAGAPGDVQAKRFGPLTDLAGTWIGRGFTLVSKPAFELKLPFVLQVNATIETLTITPIGGPIPNRGSQQNDIEVFGMTYTHEVTDAATLSLLHIEQGMWLNVPASKTPRQPQTVVRLSTIPHGDAVLAQGAASGVRHPKFPVASPIPFFDGGKSAAAGLFPPKPFKPPQVNPFPLPPGFHLDNPNVALEMAIQGQTITETVVLEVSTSGSAPAFGGVMNIPFVINNAPPISFDAVFYIETVKPPGGDPFLQLQYTQTAILRFPPKQGPISKGNQLINWPHISVATLIKQ